MRLVLAAALIAFATPAIAASQPFKCALQPDRKTVRVTIANPYKQDTHCMVDCQFATARAGTSFMVSCGTTVAAGGESEICVKTYDKGTLTTMTGGTGDCTDPTPKGTQGEDEEDDDEAMIQRLQQQGQDMLKKMQQGR